MGMGRLIGRSFWGFVCSRLRREVVFVWLRGGGREVGVGFERGKTIQRGSMAFGGGVRGGRGVWFRG